jgi:hypothetical protein
MKNLVLSTLLVGFAALPATGCIIVDDDDDDPPPVDQPPVLGAYDTVLLTSWRLLSGDQPATCKPGSNAAATLYSCPGTEATCTNPARQAFVDIGNCDVAQGTGQVDIPFANDPGNALPPGKYVVWYEFSASGEVWAKSFTKEIDLVEGRDENLEFEVQVDHGFFDVAWTLVRGTSQVACSSVPDLDAIALDVAPCLDSQCAAEGDVVQSEFEDCDAGKGRSFPILLNGNNPYATATAAIDASGGNLADPAFKDTPGPTFTFANDAYDLGTVMVQVP